MIVPLGGNTVIADVLMARKRTIASDAVWELRLSLASSVIAFRPKGVAAFPSPSMLDAMFITMAPMAGWSGGTSGNRRRSKGARRRAIQSRRPPSKAIRTRPSMNIMPPTRPMTSWMASLVPSKRPWVTSIMRPVYAANTIEDRISPSQIQLSTGTPRPVNGCDC